MNSVGIIPADLWLKCQLKLDKNRQVGNSGKGTCTWLSGLLKCAKCGYSLKVGKQGAHRWLNCSGRYQLSACDATIRVKLTDLETMITDEIEQLISQCPEELAQPQDDLYSKQLQELDRRADRLMAAFAESPDLPQAYLQRALGQLEQERQYLLESQRREQAKPAYPKTVSFSALDFEEKKAVAAQFIRRVEVAEDSVQVIWAV